MTHEQKETLYAIYSTLLLIKVSGMDDCGRMYESFAALQNLIKEDSDGDIHPEQ